MIFYEFVQIVHMQMDCIRYVYCGVLFSMFRYPSTPEFKKIKKYTTHAYSNIYFQTAKVKICFFDPTTLSRYIFKLSLRFISLANYPLLIYYNYFAEVVDRLSL